MSEGYSRQSTFIDGDVILAEHGNLEFDKLVNVFNEVSGHNHDGTTGAGSPIPLIKDLTGAQDITLTPTGISGSVILDEDDLVSDSNEHLATQQSIKAYVDALDLDLQGQIDVFQNSNHGHLNLDKLDAVGQESPQTSSFLATWGIPYYITATTAVDITLDTLVVDKIYTFSNSWSSTAPVQILNPTNTITGSVVVAAGTDILMEPGDYVSLVATSTTTLEVI